MGKEITISCDRKVDDKNRVNRRYELAGFVGGWSEFVDHITELISQENLEDVTVETEERECDVGSYDYRYPVYSDVLVLSGWRPADDKEIQEINRKRAKLKRDATLAKERVAAKEKADHDRDLEEYLRLKKIFDQPH